MQEIASLRGLMSRPDTARNNRPAHSSRPAFTLVELLVVIGIIALLISILLPVMGQARAAAQSTQCLALLRSFGQAGVLYAHESRGWALPAIFGAKTEFWPAPNQTVSKRGQWMDNDIFRKNINAKRWVGGNGTVGKLPIGFTCPQADQARSSQTNEQGSSVGYSYGYNMRHVDYTGNPVITVPTPDTWNANTVYAGLKVTGIRRAADKIMFADAMTPLLQPQNSDHYYKVDDFDDFRAPDVDDGDTLAYVAYRHGRRKSHVNVAFWDGHAESMPRSEIVAVKNPHLGANARRFAPNWSPNWLRRWDLAAR